LTVKRDDKELALTATLGSNANFQDRMSGAISQRSSGFAAALQHDLVIRPNECGSPLVDLDGRVIGINVARAGRVMSYAIPTPAVLARLEDLKSGKLAPKLVTQNASQTPDDKPNDNPQEKPIDKPEEKK
jgi:serine protease Do